MTDYEKNTSWVNKAYSMKLMIRDSLSNVLSVKVTYQGKQVAVNNDYSFVVSDNGAYTVNVTDEAGNVATQVVNIDNFDYEAPEIKDLVTSNKYEQQYTTNFKVIDADSKLVAIPTLDTSVILQFLIVSPSTLPSPSVDQT